MYDSKNQPCSSTQQGSIHNCSKYIKISLVDASKLVTELYEDGSKPIITIFGGIDP